MIVITVFGVPVAKGRPRFARRGKFVATYTPEKTRNYESILANEGKVSMRGRKPLECPLSVKIKALFPIPKSTSKKMLSEIMNGTLRYTKKPDSDNVAKLVGDALNGIVWKDDSQIVELLITKGYSEAPRIEITVNVA